LMVGDRWSTDGLFAETLGCRFAMVRSGVTLPGRQISDPDGPVAADRVHLDVADLAAVANAITAG
jgi:ribonucleotide monophosphatase NagD (HAD superfamily)